MKLRLAYAVGALLLVFQLVWAENGGTNGLFDTIRPG